MKSDGSIWFTDPPFGILGWYEGHVATPELPTNVYRWDPKTRHIDAVITDHGRAFDQVEAGYDGPLYAEIGPRPFPVLVRAGSRLSQIRFRSGEARVPDLELRDIQRRMRLVSTPDPDIAGGVAVSVDLDGFVSETIGLDGIEDAFHKMERGEVLRSVVVL